MVNAGRPRSHERVSKVDGWVLYRRSKRPPDAAPGRPAAARSDSVPPMSFPLTIGQLTVEEAGTDAIKGTTVSKQKSRGDVTLYTVTGPDGLDLLVRDVRWRVGERDVATVARRESPERYDGLVNRLRLSVAPTEDGIAVELRQARTRENGHHNLFVPTAAGLADGAGVDVVALLEAHGATVGTRELLLNDLSGHRTRLTALAPGDGGLVPLIAYVATRVAPTQRGTTA